MIRIASFSIAALPAFDPLHYRNSGDFRRTNDGSGSDRSSGSPQSPAGLKSSDQFDDHEVFYTPPQSPSSHQSRTSTTDSTAITDSSEDSTEITLECSKWPPTPSSAEWTDELEFKFVFPDPWEIAADLGILPSVSLLTPETDPAAIASSACSRWVPGPPPYSKKTTTPVDPKDVAASAYVELMDNPKVVLSPEDSVEVIKTAQRVKEYPSDALREEKWRMSIVRPTSPALSTSPVSLRAEDLESEQGGALDSAQ